MKRSTLALSLITLLALGGCNTPSESGLSETGTSSQEQVDTSASSTVADNPIDTTTPPAEVSQPVEPSPSEKEPGATTQDPVASVSSSEVAKEDSDTVTVLSAAPKVSDTTIVPGQKVGIVTGATTYSELEREFGSDRLITEEIHLGEGMMAPATQVNLDNGYSFNVVWEDPSQSKPLEVRDLEAGWDVQGIRNGMSFEDLKSTLGEFDLLGLGWDYGGTLLLENTALSDYSGQLFIRVQPSEKAVETQQEKFLAVAGDSVFSSSDPNFEALDLSVVEVVVRLE